MNNARYKAVPRVPLLDWNLPIASFQKRSRQDWTFWETWMQPRHNGKCQLTQAQLLIGLPKTLSLDVLKLAKMRLAGICKTLQNDLQYKRIFGRSRYKLYKLQQLQYTKQKAYIIPVSRLGSSTQRKGKARSLGLPNETKHRNAENEHKKQRRIAVLQWPKLPAFMLTGWVDREPRWKRANFYMLNCFLESQWEIQRQAGQCDPAEQLPILF